MQKITFDSIYKKLCSGNNKDNIAKIYEDSLDNNILDYDKEYLRHKQNYKTDGLLYKEKKYNNITYAIYMFKTPEYSDLSIDNNYNIKEEKKSYYEASMIIIKDDFDCRYSIDNICAIRNRDEQTVIKRYNYLERILNDFTESRLLEFIDSQI